MTTSCCAARSSSAIGIDGIDVEVEIPERIAGLRQARRNVDHSPACRSGVQADVLRHAELGDDVDFLRNEGDAGPLRLGDIGRPVGRAGQGHGAGIAAGGVDAGEDLNQRRLAGAVLPQERDDLPWSNREVDVVEGEDPGEPLRQVRSGDQRSRRRRPVVRLGPVIDDPAHDR